MNLSALVVAFIACQSIVVVFIAIHDWVPIGRLNNLAGIRAVDARTKLFVVTVLSTLPFAVGLAGSAYYRTVGFPTWLFYCLWITYGAGLYGMLRAWWLPYWVKPDPARMARYQKRFADTHAFLPLRNGIRPDTLHVCFHAVLVTTVFLLVILSFFFKRDVMKRLFRFGGLMAPLMCLFNAAAGDAGNSPYDADGALVPQSDYREWVFLSSGLDMSYTEKPAMQGHPMFDNVFVERKAWLAFKESGHWPDKSVFAMENRGAATKGSINKQGQYQTDNRMGVEYHIRDESRFNGGWAFFAADGDGPAALMPQSAACYSCHLAHGAVDTTFTQFYPTAKPIAVKAGSYHEK